MNPFFLLCLAFCGFKVVFQGHELYNINCEIMRKESKSGSAETVDSQRIQKIYGYF